MERDIAFYLKRIIGTKLLSYDADSLSVIMSRQSVGRKGNNSIVRQGKNARSQDQMEKDYKIFERRAEDLTEGGISCHHGYYNLKNLIDDYENISNSRLINGLLPFNEISSNINTLNTLLVNTLCDVISGASPDAEGEMIMQALGYYKDDAASFIGNYRGSIGILLLLKLIPPCNEIRRFRDDKERLRKDSESAACFISALKSKLGQPPFLTYKTFIDRMGNCISNDSWQRLSLIFWFTREIDYFAISIRPEALIEFNTPFKERVQRIPNFKESFFIVQDEQEHFFRLSPTKVIIGNKPIRLDDSCYIDDYHYHEGEIESTRYSIKFFKNGVAIITNEPSQMKSMLLGKDGVQFEAKFGYAFDGCQLIINRDKESKPNAIPFGNLSLVKIDKPGIVFPEPHNSNTVEPVAGLGGIFDNGRLLMKGYNQSYLIEVNRENGLDRLFPYLNIKDRIGIYKMEDSGNERLFLYYEKSYRRVYEITDDTDKNKYGIKELNQ